MVQEHFLSFESLHEIVYFLTSAPAERSVCVSVQSDLNIHHAFNG